MKMTDIFKDGRWVLAVGEDRWGNALGWIQEVLGKDLTIAGEDPGGFDILFRAEEADILGRFAAIDELQGGAGVIGHEVGQGGQVFDHGFAEGDEFENHESAGGQEQRHAGGQHDHEHLLALDGGAP